ncbi:hypothetical protein HELRODRAFT_182345 [Helobdella robusta]|uniref:Fibronectin type-III domain-containing protein n=1 Tax=Helobdella robusta TaxID=6412 RepID=T1FI35_HELRO|nr:hypothetical protein HELRODRAFT_182345 [Helobdella robusta]ESN91000.1 hypothetical protein HELRODRAFT_182345 [Helobdella robusta]
MGGGGGGGVDDLADGGGSDGWVETHLRVVKVEDTSIHMDWTNDNNNNVDYYKVRWKSAVQTQEKEVQLESSETRCTLHKCAPGVQHCIRLYTYDAKNRLVGRSKVVKVVTSAPAGAPVVCVKATNFNYVTIEWEEPKSFGDATITGYKVFIDGVAESNDLGSTARSFAFTGGVWCKDYVFQVQALTSERRYHSQLSEPLVVTWPGVLAPKLQRVTSPSSNYFNGVKISWGLIVVTGNAKIKNCKLHGSQKLVKSESILVAPISTILTPTISVRVRNLDERRMLDSETAILINLRDNNNINNNSINCIPSNVVEVSTEPLQPFSFFCFFSQILRPSKKDLHNDVIIPYRETLEIERKFASKKPVNQGWIITVCCESTQATSSSSPPSSSSRERALQILNMTGWLNPNGPLNEIFEVVGVPTVVLLNEKHNMVWKGRHCALDYNGFEAFLDYVTDGSRGSTSSQLDPWTQRSQVQNPAGRCLAWDVTVPGTLAERYVNLTSKECGLVAARAADEKMKKYGNALPSMKFLPICIEVLGPMDPNTLKFLKAICKMISVRSGDSRELFFATNPISCLLQRFLRVCVLENIQLNADMCN